MKKHSAWTILALLSLTGCAGASQAPDSAPATASSPEVQLASPSPTETEQATMIDVSGMKLQEAQATIEALSGFSGQVTVNYNPKAGDPTSDPSKWTVIDSSPWEGFAIPGAVVLTVALEGAPADKAAPLGSITDMSRAVQAAGIECESDMPASEAQYPDEALNCTNELVLGYWPLDTERSKTFFGLQKDSYASNKYPGSGSLAGPNWTMSGDAALIAKLRKVLGGTIL